jgi:hypothetical protein
MQLKSIAAIEQLRSFWKMLRLSITNAPRGEILPLRIDYDIMLVAYKKYTQPTEEWTVSS